MTVRLRLALTIFFTGALTALGVIAAVAFAFERFEHERTYDRANAFLDRVLANYDDVLELQARNPDEFVPWLKSLLLFEPDTQLYLLTADGVVLASTGRMKHGPEFKVALAPVQQAVAAAAGKQRAPYVMGDDPEHMAHDAVIAARGLRRAVIRPSDELAGYLYLVAQQPRLEGGRLELLRSSLAGPATLGILAVIVLTTLMAAWIVATVTRPLQVLSSEVAAASRDGFNAVPEPSAQWRRADEFGQLHEGFHKLLATLRQQWNRLLEMDQFRREGVSNLSHDLRSPLTATVACLETLQQRWQGQAPRSEDLQLVEVALRNTRNAAGLVRSLGDLALLDEPEFKLQLMLVDVGEVLDDITVRFADRAHQQGIVLSNEALGELAPFAQLDIELFERAVANVVDNALKFTARGGQVRLSSSVLEAEVLVSVADSGAGIGAADVPRLFDRLFQSRESTAPATSEGGKGLGLAIVKRIVELHGGTVGVTSELGTGTVVTIRLPRG
jgi:signal transduction histidine kinase